MDQPRLIFDIGTAYAKLGPATTPLDTALPHRIVPSLIAYHDGLPLLGEHVWRADLQPIRPITSNPIQREHWKTVSDLIEGLVDGYSLEASDVLVVESCANAQENRDGLTELLFETYEVDAVLTVPQNLLAVYSKGIVTGLSLDVGASASSSGVVVDGILIESSVAIQAFAGDALTDFLVANIQPLPNKHARLIAELLKHKLCYVSADYNAEKQPPEGSEASFILPDGEEIIVDVGWENRFVTGEVLFDPEIYGYDAFSVQGMIKTSMEGLDLFAPELWSNIILSGGATMMRGFSHRLRAELINARVPYDVKCVGSSKKRQVAAWIGGAVLANSSYYDDLCITRELFQEDPDLARQRLPLITDDLSSFLNNQTGRLEQTGLRSELEITLTSSDLLEQGFDRIALSYLYSQFLNSIENMKMTLEESLMRLNVVSISELTIVEVLQKSKQKTIERCIYKRRNVARIDVKSAKLSIRNLKLWKILSVHPYLIGVVAIDDTGSVIMEYKPYHFEQMLDSFLDDSVGRLRIAFEVTDALRTIHSHGFHHGRIRPGTILFDEDWEPSMQIFSRISASLAKNRSKSAALRYTAPENLSAKRNRRSRTDLLKSDIYSIGALLVHILTGSKPWSALNDVELIQTKSRAEEHEDEFPPELQQIEDRVLQLVLQGCFSSSLDSRPSIVELNGALKFAMLSSEDSSESTEDFLTPEKFRRAIGLESLTKNLTDEHFGPESSSVDSGSSLLRRMSGTDRLSSRTKKPSFRASGSYFSPPKGLPPVPDRRLSKDVILKVEENYIDHLMSDEEKVEEMPDAYPDYAAIEDIREFYSYDELLGDKLPPSVDRERKEMYLSDDIFFAMFHMTKEEFHNLQSFRQDDLRRQFGLL